MALIAVALFLLSLAAWLASLSAVEFSWKYSHSAEPAPADGWDVPSAVHWTHLARLRGAQWAGVLSFPFILFSVAGIPVWQQLIVSLLLALIIGIRGVAKQEAELRKADPRGEMRLFGRLRDPLWYRFVAAADWFTFLATLCFGIHIVILVIGALL